MSRRVQPEPSPAPEPFITTKSKSNRMTLMMMMQNSNIDSELPTMPPTKFTSTSTSAPNSPSATTATSTNTTTATAATAITAAAAALLPPLDLTVIDQAFGDFADLYSDVLRVSVVATHEQIQLAYFDRRSELFGLLAKLDLDTATTATTATSSGTSSEIPPLDTTNSSGGDSSPARSTNSKNKNNERERERQLAERKMDSVVLAVRILGDPEQRLQYDLVRQERLLNRRRAAHGQLPGHTARLGLTGLDSMDENEYNQTHKVKTSTTRSSKSKRKNSKKGRDRSTEPVEQAAAPVTTPTRNRKSMWGSKKNRSKKKVVAENLEPTEHDHDQDHDHNDDGDDDDCLNLSKADTVDTNALTDEEHDDYESPRDVGTRRRGGDEVRQGNSGDKNEDKSTALTSCGAVGGGSGRGRGGYSRLSLTSKDPKSPNGNDYDDENPNNGGMLSCITNSRILRQISDEISGACEDTLVSVDQVFNAFTLTDRDINAVTKKIERARKQLDH